LLDQWIISPRPNRSPKVRLVCVPYEGGGVTVFRDWEERLPEAQIDVVQLPGRGSRLRERPVDSVAAAADAVAEATVRLPAYPTVFFGHGLGALIAFEAARRLRDRRWPLLALFVSGRRAPDSEDGNPAIADLPDEQFMVEVRRRHGTFSDAILGDAESMPLIVPGLRADFAMAERYQYESAPPLDCPIVVCAGASDPHAGRADLDGWKRETRSRFHVQTFGGAHFYLHQEGAALTALIGNQLSVMLSALARLTEVR
jgi:surfactin synthase thioesterase subunit